MVKPEIYEEEFDKGIEELRELIHDIACNNECGDFVCTECISTIHSLLGILTMLTGKENNEFAKEIYDIIGE